MKSIIRYTGQYIQIRDRQGWEFVERLNSKGIVIIVAMTTQQELIFVEQYRPAVDNHVLEFPAGLVGDNPESTNESLQDAAERELLEETGYTSNKMIELVSGPISAGISNEICTFFYSNDIVKTGQGGGVDTENITTHIVPYKDVQTFIQTFQKQNKLIALQVYVGLQLLMGLL